MFNWLRIKLGIDVIEDYQRNAHQDLQESITQLHAEIGKLRLQVGVAIPGIGRIIAKLDPIFGVREDDPARIAESDRIGEAVIKRLENEYKAQRQHSGGR